MGLLRWLFGDDASVPAEPETEEMNHSVLGPIVRDMDESWRAESIEPLGCRGTPFLSISGDNEGPIYSAVATYQRLISEWNTLSAPVAELLLELNHNYVSTHPERALKSADELWRSAELLSIAIYGHGEFSLSFHFDWQHPGDVHSVIVEFERWQIVGTRIDG